MPGDVDLAEVSSEDSDSDADEDVGLFDGGEHFEDVRARAGPLSPLAVWLLLAPPLVFSC